MIIPKDVVCNFCKRIFCCSTCRLKHEEKTHAIELKQIEHQEDIKRSCVICNGKEFPLKLDGLPDEVFQHILDTHLPLKCNKCTKVFEGQADFVDFGKCAMPNQDCCLKTANIEVEKEKSTFKVPGKVADENFDERSLTPLSKINLRWRRKSRGFEPSAILDSASVSERQEDKTKSPVKNGTRQTSTPMPNNMPSRSISNYTDSSLSIHISSINYTSGTSSSDSDSCISPPVQQLKEKVKVTPKSPTVPKRGANIQNRNRPKLPVQATPLRQVMSKSIQKALAQHGFYKQFNYSGLQQRKVCFDSTGSDSSGGESTGNSTSSFRPLDLRTTPVLRRTQSDSSGSRLWRMQQEQREMQSNQMKDETEEGEDKENQSEMKDNSEIYYSCPSLASLVDPPENVIEETPKITNANVGMLKKAISFETPLNNEELTVGPPLLTSEEDDVFYTPCATPQRSYSCSEIDFQMKKSEIKELSENPEKKKSDGTFWNLVSSVVAVASKKSEKPVEVKSQSKFNFTKGALVQKAASFAGFLRSLRGSDDDAQVQSPLAKRRRTVVNDLSTIQSPLKKRQKIQGRKPIERMRNPS